MCGKGSSQPSMPTPYGGSMPVTSTQSVSIPPDVLARYNAVNAQAQQTAQQPFNPYAQYPSAFVSPLTQSQQAAIYNINRAQGMTEPYYQQAAQMAGASTAGAYNPAVAGISDPYYRAATQGTQAGMGQVANYGVAGISSPAYQQAAQQAQYAGRDVASGAVAQVSDPYYQASRNLGLGAAQGVASRDVAMASQPAYNAAGQMTQQAARGVADLGVAGISSPAYQQAQQMTGMAGQVQVPQLGAADIQQYMSPYMQQIIDPTMKALRQQQEQAMAGQTGAAIRQGAFGGDRASLAAAQLAGQQQLAQGQTLGGLLQQGYGQALSTAQQQQQIRQAEMARILQAGRQQADIGTMQRQAYEQQQALAQQDQARRLQAAQQYAGLGTLSREALQQQQAMAQTDLARQLQVAQQQQGLGTAARQAYEQQQAVAQADAARQLEVSKQQQALGTAQRQAYEQQQAIQQADLQRQIAGAQQLAGIGTQARQAAEQQQAIRQADLNRMQQAAQLMGGLGTGAQAAALSAAQAQLGAGAAEQQTSQAGLQALYNQYLQQQAYPFQVAQFLGNIAMGTGALSGSTTTTAQAQPFFSDRRLKEGVGAAKYGAEGGEEPEIIGETYDGQKIYRYRLNNPVTGELEPPQIGLMADEAEKRRPDAVNENAGFKMLDYKAATDDAAAIGKGLGAARMGGAVEEAGDYARGGYARGGLGYVYNSPDSLESQMDRILSGQESMYNTGVGGVGGSPYGGGGGITAKGYVPQVEIGSYRLLEPASPPPALTPESSKIMGGIEKAAGLAGGLEKLYKFGQENFGGDPLGGTHTGKFKHASGGVIPYENKGEDYFPEEVLKQPDIQPLKAAEAPKPVTPYKEDSLLDKASGAVDTASKIATIGSLAMKAAPYVASMFSDRRLKSGVGYADGGPADDEDAIRREREIEQTLKFEGGLNPSDTNRTPSMYGINQAAHPGIDVRKLTPEGAKDIYRKEYWEGIGASKLPENLQGMAYDTAVIAGPGRARKMLAQAGDDPNKFMAARESFLQNLIARDPEKYGKYEKAWSNRNETLRRQAGLGDADNVLANIPAGGRSFYATTAGKGLGAGASALPPPTTVPTVEAVSEKGKDIGDFLTSKEFIIPALTGLGAMASSPSRYLGSAILQGVGAGAQSYMDVLGKESELAKRAAETGEVKARTGTQEQETEKRKAETLRQYQDLYKDAFFDRGGIQMVRLADGSAMSLYEWMKSPRPVWGQGAEGAMPGEPTPTAPAAAGKPISVAPANVEAPVGIGFDNKSSSSAKAELGMLNTPGKAALEARSAEYRNMVDKDAEVARDQKLFNNEVAGVISEMASKTGMQTPGATGSMRAMIVNYGNTISRAAGLGDQFGTSDTAQAILEKINTLAAESRVSAAGQQALGSLQKVVGAYPNLDQPPAASTFNAASNMVNNQMKLDRQQHADVYGQESGQLYSRAGVDFKRSNTPAKYKKEQDALQSTMMKDPQAFAAMVSGRVSSNDIEQYFRDKAHGGIAGMGRYFGD